MDPRPLKRKIKPKRSKQDKLGDEINRNEQLKVMNVSGIFYIVFTCEILFMILDSFLLYIFIT